MTIKNYKYMKLSPQDNIDNNEYFKALNQGIEDQDISNIALTGPYGSGKSSILKTFKKKNDGYCYLSISLASFNESQDNILSVNEGENESKKETKNNKRTNLKDISKLIQESILKQIFYQVESNKIPFSRFKRINNKSNESFLLDIAYFILWIVSFLVLFKPNLINPVISPILTPDFINENSIKILSSTLFFGLSFLFLYKLYFLVYSKIKFMRIKFLDTELELNTTNDSSVLSKNSDELIYLFEVTDYEVVIIEDLDRFENIDVFTKLRELNEMLNNADNIHRNINFVYALKDDLFNKFSDRLKFFDMIIPVVPIVNATNSANKINSIIEEYDIDLDRNFINEISSYIDDMRLIKNIFNEYSIYSNSLDPDLDNEDLFSVITYKNKYPKDFSDSLKGEGLIYQTFDRKRKNILDSIENIKEKIEKNDDKLKIIENERVESIEELNLICGGFILSNYNADRIRFIKNRKNSDIYKLSEFIKRENFNEFLNSDEVQTVIFINNRKKPSNKIDTAEILDLVDYNKRRELIELKSKKKNEKIKKRIRELKEDQEYIKNCSFSEYYSRFSSSKFFNDKKYENNDLLKFLLINGYIKESTYENYISYLDSSNMTIKDNKFIIKILSGQSLDFSYELTNINKIVETLNSEIFLKKEILNYDLLKYLIENKKKHNNYFKLVMEQIGDGSKKSISFIEGFINFSKENILEDFIKTLAQTWKDYWYYLIHESNYTSEVKKNHLIWTLKYVDIEDIITINEDDIFKEYFEEQSNIINLSVENNIINETKEVLNQLDIKFNKINLNLIEENDNKKKDLFEYIYENNFYKINIPMISTIIKNKISEKGIEKKINTKNYTTILENKLEVLNKYLEDNIVQYIDNVFLKLENNNESSETLIKLLNNGELNLEKKKKILDLSRNKIVDLNKVDCHKEIFNYLLEVGMVESNWVNLLFYYKNSDKKLNNIIVNFINNKSNYQQLRKLEISDEKFNGLLSKNEIKLFIKNLFESNSISINAAKKIVGSINWQYQEFSFKSMDEEKLKLLIKENILILSSTNYNEIKSANHLNHTHILLLESNEEEFLDNISQYNFEEQDIIEILNSNKLNIETKEQFINTIDFNNLLNINNLNPDNLEQILDLLNDLGSRVKILTKYVPKLDFEEITKMLKTIGRDYSTLTNLRKRPTLDNGNYNSGLLKKLKEKGYISSYSLDKNNKEFNVVNRYPNGGDN